MGTSNRMPAFTVTIEGIEYRMVRDGMEWRKVARDAKWDSVDMDREPDAHEQAAFDALEQIGMAIG